MADTNTDSTNKTSSKAPKPKNYSIGEAVQSFHTIPSHTPATNEQNILGVKDDDINHLDKQDKQTR
jgi:hypothetical protein